MAESGDSRCAVKKLRSKKHEQHQNSGRDQEFGERKSARPACFSVRCPQRSVLNVSKQPHCGQPGEFRGYTGGFVISHRLISVKGGKHFCGATRICRRGSGRPGNFQISVAQSGGARISPGYVQLVAKLQRWAPCEGATARAGLTLCKPALSHEHEPGHQNTASRSPKCYTKLSRSSAGCRCGSQVADHRSHDVRRRGLGSRVTIRLHTDRDYAENGD